MLGSRLRHAQIAVLAVMALAGGCSSDDAAPRPEPLPTDARGLAARACAQFLEVFTDEGPRSVEQARRDLEEGRDTAAGAADQDASWAELRDAMTETLLARGDTARVTRALSRVDTACRPLLPTPSPSAS